MLKTSDGYTVYIHVMNLLNESFNLHTDEREATNMKLLKLLFAVLHFQKARIRKESEYFLLTQRVRHRYVMNLEGIHLVSVCHFALGNVLGSFPRLFSNLPSLCQRRLLRY